MDIVWQLFAKFSSPLLRYLKVCYGPVLRFDTGTAIEHWTGQITSIDGIPIKRGRLQAPNFTYRQCSRQRTTDIPFHQPLGMDIDARFILSTVVVKVPTNATHNFWRRQSYDWTVDGSAYEFSVERFGGTNADADWWATNFAMEIIRCARAHATPKLAIPTSEQSDSALDLCCRLHKLWEEGSESFKNFSVNKAFWLRANSELDSMIKASTEFEWLLKYYKVNIFQFLSFY